MTTSAPPSFRFMPLARSRVFAGELGEILSVSWPEAPPGMRFTSQGFRVA